VASRDHETVRERRVEDGVEDANDQQSVAETDEIEMVEGRDPDTT